MTCEPCTSSPERVADSSQTSSSDTGQLSLLNGINTPAMYLEPEHQMDGSPACECGKGMFSCSIHPNTPEKWIASMQGSLAKICQSLEPVLDLAKKHVADCTERSCGWLTQYDQDTCSWKTSQTSIVPELEQFTETWPRSVMSSGQYAYALPMLERLTIGTGGGVSPDGMSFHHTPNTTGMDGGSNSRKAMKKRLAKIFPTPAASDNRDRGNLSTPSVQRRMVKGKQISLRMSVSTTSGQLNPDWTEWLMGWPVGHTDLSVSVTGKSHYRPQPHSEFSKNCLEASQ